MSFFDELKASLEEAVEIKNGTKAPPCDSLRVGRRQGYQGLLRVKWKKCWPSFRLTRNSLMNWWRIKLM